MNLEQCGNLGQCSIKPSLMNLSTPSTAIASEGKEKYTRWRPKFSKERSSFAFSALVAFCFLYYYRPEDFILPLAILPMAKIVGGIGLVALIVRLREGGSRNKIPLAVKLVFLLFVQMALAIPFALWRGGAFAMVFESFDKAVIIAFLVALTIEKVSELRTLLWIQVSAVALVTLGSIIVRHVDKDGRLMGVQRGILENPNDLAINIAISFPLAMAFMLRGRGWRKAVWLFAMAVMSVGVVLTYSRSGLLAFILTVLVCIWEYGIKGKRFQIVAAATVIFIFGIGLALSSSHYRTRVESIFMGNIQGSADRGSLEGRKELLKRSIKTALTHPLVGVGPGCFPLVEEGWRVAHNSYTELAAEAGFPALILFLLAFWSTFKNVAVVRKSTLYKEDVEFQLFTQALWAALAAYMAGACFASIEYSLYPYFMVGYSCAMIRIAQQRSSPDTRGEKRILKKASYGTIRRPQTIWTR